LASRRQFLRWLMVSAVGAGIFVLADGLAKNASQMSSANAAFLRVKVRYFQMAQYVSVGDEYFDLQSPALLRDLLNAVSLRHSSISPGMIASMMIFVNGTPAKTNAELNDGDEVDLIPPTAGG
jgi:molybdopterin converting factor small subunit